jgi:hypothetical protein
VILSFGQALRFSSIERFTSLPMFGPAVSRALQNFGLPELTQLMSAMTKLPVPLAAGFSTSGR